MEVLSVLLLLYTIIDLGGSDRVLDSASSDFVSLLKSSVFVDKTKMIKRAVTVRSAVINAPRLFGKSTNLDMLKSFFEIQVDAQGKPLSEFVNTQHLVNDTSNYKLFVDNNLKICKDKKFMKEHFGKYPVITVDFCCNRELRTTQDAMDVFAEAVHRSYKQHKYLLDSAYVPDCLKHDLRMWCEETTFRQHASNYSANGTGYVGSLIRLDELANGLKIHFQNISPVVLIDNHDSVFKSALMSGFDFEQLVIIKSILVQQLHTFIGCYSLLDTSFSFATGVLDIPRFGEQWFTNGYTHRFLDVHDNAFHGFYGLTKKEVLTLFTKSKFNIDSDFAKKVFSAYGRYESDDGEHIYNLYSILNFLKSGIVRNYWIVRSSLQNLRNTGLYPVLKYLITSLLFNQFYPPDEDNIHHYRDYITEDGVLPFLDGLQKSTHQKDSKLSLSLREFLLHFLLQEGFIYRRGLGCPYQVPNGEVRNSLEEFIA